MRKQNNFVHCRLIRIKQFRKIVPSSSETKIEYKKIHKRIYQGFVTDFWLFLQQLKSKKLTPTTDSFNHLHNIKKHLSLARFTRSYFLLQELQKVKNTKIDKTEIHQLIGRKLQALEQRLSFTCTTYRNNTSYINQGRSLIYICLVFRWEKNPSMKFTHYNSWMV